MAYFRMSDAFDALKRSRTAEIQTGRQVRKAEEILREEVRAFKPADHYDIFLSHCFRDAERILAVKALLQSQGKKVYVDWIDDPQLDRENVTAETADWIRQRMKSCDALVYAVSTASKQSRWMPWELGYFDGLKAGRVSILPLIEDQHNGYPQEEYLYLYPVIEQLPQQSTGQLKPYVVKKATKSEPRKWMQFQDFTRDATRFAPF
jgi:hypothetical protein